MNSLVFITETECFYCAVRAEYMMQFSLSLLRVNLETTQQILHEDLEKRKLFTKCITQHLADEYDGDALLYQSRRCGDHPSTFYT
jgi:hypothetical protein